MKILDANMILRYLIRDNEEMAESVKDILRSDSVLVLPEVIAEVIYVLHGVYKFERTAIADGILRFLNISSVTAEKSDVLRKGIEIYREHNLDFVDCLLYAYHSVLGYEVCTFDKKLNRLIRDNKEDMP